MQPESRFEFIKAHVSPNHVAACAFKGAPPVKHPVVVEHQHQACSNQEWQFKHKNSIGLVVYMPQGDTVYSSRSLLTRSASDSLPGSRRISRAIEGS